MATAETQAPEPIVEELADGTAQITINDDTIEEAATAGADARLVPSDDESEDDPEAARREVLNARTTEEREAIRERRRIERQEKREARIRREQDKDRQLAEMQETVRSQQEQIGLILQRNRGTELAQLDGAIKRTADAQNYYKRVIADGVSQQNGTVVADATARMQEAAREYDSLQNVRRTFSQAQVARPATQNEPTGQDPEVLRHAVGWMNANKWYNPRGSDAETQLVKALDNSVFATGLLPGTPEYWSELDKRIATNLPHRVKGGSIGADTSRRSDTRSVVTGSGKSSASVNGGQQATFALSADRVKALKDAGMWDDTKARNDAIRRYRDYDRAAAAEKS